MGQAKRRGTYEQRKAQAIERDRHERSVRAQLLHIGPSPKHIELMSAIAALTQIPVPKAGGKE